MAKVTVLENQSLFDLSLQTLGSVEAVFHLAEKNNLSLTDYLPAGTVLNYDENAVTDKKTVAAYQRDNVKPATYFGENDLATVLLGGEGIDFWRIEFEFVIQ